MREIEFRGRLLNGEWVTGSLFNRIWRKSNSGVRVCDIFPDNMLDKINGDCWDDFASVAEDYEVDSTTVGQYTGLRDKNDKKIYEMDIVKSGRNGRLYVVVFRDGMFYGSVNEFNKELCGGFPLHALTSTEEGGHECEVVGNFYDDKMELLGKEEKMTDGEITDEEIEEAILEYERFRRKYILKCMFSRYKANKEYCECKKYVYFWLWLKALICLFFNIRRAFDYNDRTAIVCTTDEKYAIDAVSWISCEVHRSPFVWGVSIFNDGN